MLCVQNTIPYRIKTVFPFQVSECGQSMSKHLQDLCKKCKKKNKDKKKLNKTTT